MVVVWAEGGGGGSVVSAVHRGDSVSLSLPEGHLALQQLHRVNGRPTESPQTKGQGRKRWRS